MRQQLLERLRGLVPLLLPGQAQSEAGDVVRILRIGVEQLAEELLRLGVLLEIVQRLGEIELRALVFRIGGDERAETIARAASVAGAQVEVRLLPLQLEVHRILVDQRLQQRRRLSATRFPADRCRGAA